MPNPKVPQGLEDDVPPGLSAFTKQLDDELNATKDWFVKEPPQELVAFIKSELKASDKSLGYFTSNDLVTIRDIAKFGSQDLKEILSLVQVSNLVDPEFIEFVKQVSYLSQYFASIGGG